jgi:hypothetical protein
MWRGWRRRCVRRGDWLFVALLLGAAIWLGGPLIHEMPFARYLRGECSSMLACREAPADPRRVGPERITMGPGIIDLPMKSAHTL